MATDDGQIWAIAEADERDPMYWQDPDRSGTAWGPIGTAHWFTDAERIDMEILAERVRGVWVEVGNYPHA